MNIHQIQALDYELKKISDKRKINLKPVISVNGILWTGDFIRYDDESVQIVKMSVTRRREFILDENYPGEYNEYLKAVTQFQTTLHTDNLAISKAIEATEDFTLIFEGLLPLLSKITNLNDLPPFIYKPINLSRPDEKTLDIMRIESENIELVSIIDLATE